MSSNRDRLRYRYLAIAGLLIALTILLVLAGGMTPDPAMNQFPDEDAVGEQPAAYMGEKVSLGGEVINTDPVVISVEYDGGSFELTLTDLDESVEVGQEVSVFGTVTDSATLEVERVLVRWPWEGWYMYAVSVLAAGWVFIRMVRQWRFDREALAFTPRGDHDG